MKICTRNITCLLQNFIYIGTVLIPLHFFYAYLKKLYTNTHKKVTTTLLLSPLPSLSPSYSGVCIVRPQRRVGPLGLRGTALEGPNISYRHQHFRRAIEGRMKVVKLGANLD